MIVNNELKIISFYESQCSVHQINEVLLKVLNVKMQNLYVAIHLNNP